MKKRAKDFLAKTLDGVLREKYKEGEIDFKTLLMIQMNSRLMDLEMRLDTIERILADSPVL